MNVLSLYASIDLLAGRVARLFKGDPDKATFYEGSPLSYASKWVGEGADWLHIIDLDAALERGDNMEEIRLIIKNVKAPIQVGGGIRSVERAEELIKAGASRVIISSIFFKDRNEAERIIDKIGVGNVAVALDCDGSGFAAIRGWKEKTKIHMVDALNEIMQLGIKNVIITDISRDGTLAGVSKEFLSIVPQDYRRFVIIAGGVAGVNDVLTVADMGFSGIILGKALYEKKLNIKQLRSMFKT